MTVTVTLISAYKSLKMLTNVGKIEFKDGVARVKFNDEKEAKAFKDNLLSNDSLKAYVRLADEKQASKVEQLHIDNQNASGLQAGAQTSEVKENAAEAAKPTPANIFSLAKKED